MRFCSPILHWQRKSTCHVYNTTARVGTVPKTMQKSLAACLEPAYLELQMWEERTCSWCTWCAQRWGHKKPCRSSPGEPAPQHPSVSVRGADSDPHASRALSSKPKQAGQRHSSAPQLQCSMLFPVCTKPWPCLMSHRPDAVLQTPVPPAQQGAGRTRTLCFSTCRLLWGCYLDSQELRRW